MAKDIRKEKKGINVFDVTIILLVLCLIGTFAYRIYAGVSEKKTVGISSYAIRFECDETVNSVSEYLKGGKAVYLASTGELLGYIGGGKNAITLVELTETEAPDTFAESESDTSVGSGAEETIIGTEGASVAETEAETVKTSGYCNAIISGSIVLTERLNVFNGGIYYSIGDVNFVAGSTLEVYTDDAVFTITIKSFYRID